MSKIDKIQRFGTHNSDRPKQSIVEKTEGWLNINASFLEAQEFIAMHWYKETSGIAGLEDDPYENTSRARREAMMAWIDAGAAARFRAHADANPKKTISIHDVTTMNEILRDIGYPADKRTAH